MKKLLNFIFLLTICALSIPLLTVGLAADASVEMGKPC